jgi:hypothetical protein
VPKQGSSYPAGRTPVKFHYANCKPRVPLIFQANRTVPVARKLDGDTTIWLTNICGNVFS